MIPFSISTLSNPLYLGIITTLVGGAATVSIIKLEYSHSPISNNVTKLGTSISTFLKSPPVKSNTVQSSGTQTKSSVEEKESTSTIVTQLRTGVSSARQGFDDIKSLITTGDLASEKNSESFVSKLKNLYEKLKESKDKQLSTDGVETNRIQLWVDAIKEWYSKQTSTEQKTS